MDNLNAQTLISYIKENFPNNVEEIADVLDLLNLSIDGLLESANKKLISLHKDKEYEESMDLIKFSKEISAIQEKIKELYLDLNNEDIDDDKDVSLEQKEIPNYAAYTVDSSVPHSLYEDFKYKKVVGFSMQGKRYEAKDWKDVLVKTCNILSEVNAQKFYSFLNDNLMKERKINYFSTKYICGKNEKINNLNIYVWVNLSANGKKNLIRKVLKKFQMKFNDYSIFLRADYTPLHLDSHHAL